MESEKLIKILKQSKIIILNNESSFCELDDKLDLNRTISFSVRGVDYSIIWFKNLCSLMIGEVEVKFDNVQFSGTWPNHFKNNLQFYYGKNVVCILPVEEYGK